MNKICAHLFKSHLPFLFMRRGFSLYAPLVGVILLGVSLLILASFMNEENARIGYLRVLRASYAYLLPTQSMRYDAFTAFSVAARIYFQDEYIKPGEKPDVGKFLSNFLAGFTVPAGTEIKGARISWDSSDVDIQQETRGDYILLKVRLKQPPGPTYSLTVDAGGGREETIEVPIFEQEETTIYVPYPYGKIRQIAENIQSKLKPYAAAGNIAFGYCSKIFEKRGGVKEGYMLGSKLGTGSKEELSRELANFLNNHIANRYNAYITRVWFPEIRTRKEVNVIHYISVDKKSIECLLPYNDRRTGLIQSCSEFYTIVGEFEKPCAYVTSIGAEGTIKIGNEEYRFRVFVPLTDSPAFSGNKTEKDSHYKLGALNPHIPSNPYYCCQVSCRRYTTTSCQPKEDCEEEYNSCMNSCKHSCQTLVNKLKDKLRRYHKELTSVDIYCPQGIHTAVLCDEHGKCHYRDRQGRKK